MQEELLTQAEAAKMLRITPKTLRIWSLEHEHRQLLAPYRISNRCVRYPLGNILKFLEKSKSISV